MAVAHHCYDLLFPLSGVLGKQATQFYFFLFLRCFSSFLPALKATCVACFLSFRCLLPLHKPRKATPFHFFLSFRCFSSFLPALKTTCVACFLFLRCLLPLHKPRKATQFHIFLSFRCFSSFLPALKATHATAQPTSPLRGAPLVLPGPSVFVRDLERRRCIEGVLCPHAPLRAFSKRKRIPRRKPMVPSLKSNTRIRIDGPISPLPARILLASWGGSADQELRHDVSVEFSDIKLL